MPEVEGSSPINPDANKLGSLRGNDHWTLIQAKQAQERCVRCFWGLEPDGVSCEKIYQTAKVRVMRSLVHLELHFSAQLVDHWPREI